MSSLELLRAVTLPLGRALMLVLLLVAACGAAEMEPEDPGTTLSSNALAIVQLAQAGIDESVIIAFIESAREPFGLSSEDVVYLKDVGLTPTVIAAMLRQDARLGGNQALVGASPAITNPPPAALETNVTAPVYVTNAPQEVTYFYNALSPYGTWIELAGVGWCWQPSVVVIDPFWKPYWQGGNWIYTDFGWYWRSDYSWGWAPFHYGRWHHHHRFRWVWVPDLVWAPAWVAWRYRDAYCGWAPLPPGAHFSVGHGWRFHGVSVGLSFDFGLSFGDFSYLEIRHLRERHLDRHAVAASRARLIHDSSTVVNNQFRAHDQHMINPGLPADRVASVSGIPVAQTRVAIGGRVGDPGIRRPERVERIGQSTVIRRPELRTPVHPESVVAQKVDDRTRLVRLLPRLRPSRALPSPTAPEVRLRPQEPAARPRSDAQSDRRPSPGSTIQPLPGMTLSRGATLVPGRSPLPMRPGGQEMPRGSMGPPATTPAPAPAPGPDRVSPSRGRPELVPAPRRVMPSAPRAESPRGHQHNPAYLRPAVPPSQPAVPRSPPRPQPSIRPSPRERR